VDANAFEAMADHERSRRAFCIEERRGGGPRSSEWRSTAFDRCKRVSPGSRMMQRGRCAIRVEQEASRAIVLGAALAAISR